MALIATGIQLQTPIPPPKKVPLFTSDSYPSLWIINKVNSHLDAYRRQERSIKNCTDKKYVIVYEVGCWIVALKSWYLYFLPDTLECRGPRLVWRPEWNTTKPPRLVHSPWHGLLVIILIGPTCTKLVRMWNRLSIPCVTTWNDAGVDRNTKNSADVKPGFPVWKVEQNKG